MQREETSDTLVHGASYSRALSRPGPTCHRSHCYSCSCGRDTHSHMYLQHHTINPRQSQCWVILGEASSRWQAELELPLQAATERPWLEGCCTGRQSSYNSNSQSSQPASPAQCCCSRDAVLETAAPQSHAPGIRVATGQGVVGLN